MQQRLRRLLLLGAITILILLLTACAQSEGLPGVDTYIRVQEGRIRVADAEILESYSEFGQTIEARPGHVLVHIELDVKGDVPIAGMTTGYESPVSGAWTLMDGDYDVYKPVSRTSALLFEVEEPAEGLVLWLGNNIAMPLGPFFGHEPVIVDVTLDELIAAAREPASAVSEAEDGAETADESSDDEAPAAEEPEEVAQLACVTCHTDDAILKDLAVAEEGGEGLSEGEG